MHKIRSIANGVLGLMCLVYLTGCAAAVVGAGAAAATYVYTDGWLEYEYNAGFERAWDASMLALQDQGVRITSQDKEIADGEIEGVYNGEKVWVDLEASSRTETVIGVRVTVLGDKQASRTIHEAIARRL